MTGRVVGGVGVGWAASGSKVGNDEGGFWFWYAMEDSLVWNVQVSIVLTNRVLGS